VCGRYYGLADLDAYRLFVSRDDGHLIGPAKTIHAANDPEAIGYAEEPGLQLVQRSLEPDELRLNKQFVIILRRSVTDRLTVSKRLWTFLRTLIIAG
jgi:hypothetical protein